jgi:peptide/nickel transport system substrate-binding protein
MMRTGGFVVALIAAGLLLAGRVGGVAAQETPHHGGELVFVVPAEPPSFDAHREESFALIHPAAAPE